ncbi:MAG: hypothetical protein M3Q50_09485 [Chloroflexota bacterium]|nr:hypothetical protein [Chloroflexia bacterium]MDQ3226845.1 hypothetical protein [Chloroflexota bacterium]
MVASSRAQTNADRVRSLNLPRPVRVTIDGRTGLPITLYEPGRSRAIECVQDSWQVDDEWWREPISRRYLQVILRNGVLRTLFHDRIADRWFEQTY